MKSKTDRFNQLEITIIEQHRFELPEIMVVPISTGSVAYSNWPGEHPDK